MQKVLVVALRKQSLESRGLEPLWPCTQQLWWNFCKDWISTSNSMIHKASIAKYLKFNIYFNCQPTKRFGSWCHIVTRWWYPLGCQSWGYQRSPADPEVQTTQCSQCGWNRQGFLFAGVHLVVAVGITWNNHVTSRDMIENHGCWSFYFYFYLGRTISLADAYRCHIVWMSIKSSWRCSKIQQLWSMGVCNFKVILKFHSTPAMSNWWGSSPPWKSCINYLGYYRNSRGTCGTPAGRTCSYFFWTCFK